MLSQSALSAVRALPRRSAGSALTVPPLLLPAPLLASPIRLSSSPEASNVSGGHIAGTVSSAAGPGPAVAAAAFCAVALSTTI